MTGYQEILTDPSYAGQIITFTFPHIGNVGTNTEDIETATPAARGLVVRDATSPSRPTGARRRPLDSMARSARPDRDRRRRHAAADPAIRDGGAPNGVHRPRPATARSTSPRCRRRPRAWPGLEGMDLANEVSCRQSYGWDETAWQRERGYGRQRAPRFHVVAVDYGAKRNILRMLAAPAAG